MANSVSEPVDLLRRCGSPTLDAAMAMWPPDTLAAAWRAQ
jgi:hypothetical protein